VTCPKCNRASGEPCELCRLLDAAIARGEALVIPDARREVWCRAVGWKLRGGTGLYRDRSGGRWVVAERSGETIAVPVPKKT